MLLLQAYHLVLASTLLSQAYGSALAPAILPRATVCNGHAELCSRSYGNVTFVGAHDSYAITKNKVGTGNSKSTSTNLFLSSLLLSVELLFSWSQSRSKWYILEKGFLLEIFNNYF